MTPSASLVSVYWLVLLATLLVSGALVEARRPTISEEGLERAQNDDEYGGSDDDDDDNDRSELDYWPGLPDQSEAEPRIIGGRAIEPGEFPFVVRIIHTTVRDFVDSQHGCTASIIDWQHLLTAARCLIDPETNRAYTINDTFLVVGDFSRTSYDDGGKVFEAERYFLHPEYRHGESHENDIAIIKTRGKMSYQRGDAYGFGKVDKIDLPTRKDYEYHPEKVMVAGWGKREATDPPANIMRVLETKLIACNRGKVVFDSRWICISGIPKSTCYGDAGGPLFYKKADGRSVQLGITSFEPGNGCGNDIRLLVSVLAFVNWIDRIISLAQ